MLVCYNVDLMIQNSQILVLDLHMFLSELQNHKTYCNLSTKSNHHPLHDMIPTPSQQHHYQFYIRPVLANICLLLFSMSSQHSQGGPYIFFYSQLLLLLNILDMHQHHQYDNHRVYNHFVSSDHIPDMLVCYNVDLMIQNSQILVLDLHMFLSELQNHKTYCNLSTKSNHHPHGIPLNHHSIHTDS